MNYVKPPLTIDEHIELLKQRYLIIENEDRAKKYLKNIGYYRLTGYMYHLKEENDNFKDGVTFDLIINHYHFDKKLRSLVMEYLERIEVSLRAQLTDIYSVNDKDFFWYLKRDNYQNINVYDSIVAEVTGKFENPKEQFLIKFKNKYDDPMPPSNMAMEILNLGSISKLYGGLKNESNKQEIANCFGLQSTILTSWLIYLCNVRNICAHHGRLWNRRITADRPVIPKRKKYKFYGELPINFNSTFYGVASIIDRLLVNTNSNNHFITKIIKLIDSSPFIETRFMGLPDDWKQNPAWGYSKISFN